MRYSILLGKLSGLDFCVEQTETSVLLSRLGFIRHTNDGAVSLLPLGRQVLGHMEDIFAERLAKNGVQNVELPQLVKQDCLFASGRYEIFDGDALFFRNENGEEFFQTSHYEEIVVEFLKNFSMTDNDFPICIYFYTNKIRPIWEQTKTALASREYRALNMFSAHRNMVELNNFVPIVAREFTQLFQQWGIEVMYAETELHHSCGEKAMALVANMNGKGSESFLVCPACGYMSRRYMARSRHVSYVEECKPSEKVRIPKSCKSYSDLCEFLDVTDHSVIRSDLFRTENAFVLVVYRGDYKISKEKLLHQLSGTYIRSATEAEISMFSLQGNFLSPIGFENDSRLRVIVDESVVHGSNFVIPLNDGKYVLKNANFGVDFDALDVMDITAAKEGDLSLECGVPLVLRKESELVRIIKTGTEYSQRMGLKALVRGKNVPVCLGSYSVDMIRAFYIVAEKARDENGFCWPKGLEPFTFFLYSEGQTLRAKEALQTLYKRFPAEILLDDREVSGEEKARTAQLLGIPYTMVIYDELLDRDCFCLYVRATGERGEYPLDFSLLEFKHRNHSF